MGGASVPYLLGSELPNAAVREKTQSLGGAWNVVWAFVTNFVIPYLNRAIHFKVGFIFGGISVIALVFTFFFLPETKVRLHHGNRQLPVLTECSLTRVAHWRRSMPSLKSRSVHFAGQ